jgi:hypothetical protein
MMQRRFPFCRDYLKCLENAVLYNRNLDCRGCSCYEPVEQKYRQHEVAGMEALLRRIFNRGTESHLRFSGGVSRGIDPGNRENGNLRRYK